VCSWFRAKELKMQGCALAVLGVDCHQWTEMTQDMRATDQGWWLKKKVRVLPQVFPDRIC